MFYPADRSVLSRNCLSLLAQAEKNLKDRPTGKIFGIISPHAGYPYSGLTAAHGYTLLSEREFESVIVISPSHREYFDGVSVYPGDAYSTPLGEIEIDQDLRASILKKIAPQIMIESDLGHRMEHAVEVQLPFLQLKLREFKFLPLVMGDQKPDYCRVLGEAVAEVVKEKRVLVVASSDLSHYYDYDKANNLDQVCANRLKEDNVDGFLEDLEARRCEACGGGPIASCLIAGKKLGHTKVDILYHCNSGDSTGDKSAVVGYLSAIIS